MAGQYGVAQAKVLVTSVAEIVNVAAKVLNKSGIFALFGLIDPINKLKAVDMAAFKQELGELDPAERAEVESAFKAAISLPDKATQEKVLGMVDLLEQGLVLAGDGVALFNKGQSLVDEGKALVERVKAILAA